MKAITPFDQSEHFKNNIAPKVEELKTLCEAYSIPFFAEFVTKNTENHTYYYRDGLVPPSMGYHLVEDTIRHHIKVGKGMRPISPEFIDEYTMEPVSTSDID